MKIVCAAPVRFVSGSQDKTVVYFTSKGSQKARSYAVPTNPRSANQTAVRNAMTTLSQAWAGLTGDQRTGWGTYASTHKTFNVLGNEIESTALGSYLALGSINILRGAAAVAAAPTVGAPAGLSSISVAVSAVSTTLTLTLNHAHSSVLNKWVMLRYLPTASIAYTPDKRKMRLASGADSDSFKALVATGQTVAFTNIHTAMVDGTNFMYAICVIDENGQQSPWLTGIAQQGVA